MAGDRWWEEAPLAQSSPAPAKRDEWWKDAPVVASGKSAAPDTVPLAATGEAHDGDTFRLSDGRNARLYGADAFELAQQGRIAGKPVLLGQMARTALLPFATPSAVVTPTGASTYGRPVAVLTNGGKDAGAALLHDGLALSTTQYLRGDPQRLADYTQEERLARLNRRGAFAGEFQTPADYRHGKPDPWNAPEAGSYGNSDAVFFDDPTPAQGLKPEVEEALVGIWQDFTKGPADYIAYAKAQGLELDPSTVAEQFRKRDRDHNAGGNGIPTIARPRVPINPGDGKLGATLRGFADPINVLDEAGALVDSLVPGSERENVWSSDRRFGDVYANNLEQNRAVLAYDDLHHPWWRFGGQLASGLAMPALSGEGVGFNAARAVLRQGGSRFAAENAARRAFVGRLGLSGAIEGGAAGGGAGEDTQSRLLGATVGAPVGAGLGVTAGVLAPKVASLVGRPFSRLTGRAGERTAEDFSDGALDAGKAIAGNDLAPAPRQAGAASDAAMAAESEQPSIYGPSFEDTPPPPDGFTVQPDRAADRIDVTQPRPMSADYTDAERMAAAERLRSGDVLPLPNNTVDGIDEAARIERGRYAPLRTPDERDEAGSRTIPHAVTGSPIKVRGPLDLVSFLRMQGGIKPQGGELEHLGITNAPRKGIDFAGGDRVGPLISRNGMGYDDAAYAAWEAGYFPGHTERPTIPEFLDALDATHSGRDRLFHPDDAAEVEAFNAARNQRWDAERAAREGAPYSTDAAQPVDMGDLDANAPPVRAYEEWGENAPNLAGNIRLDKLDSPQAIKRVLMQTENVTGGFDAARRGRITQAETANLAADLGMTADDLLKRRKGEAFNAEQALAARQILARSATDLVNIAKRISRTDNPGDELEAAFREVWLRHAAIQEQVAGMTAEAGRLLSQFRQAADAGATDRVLPSLASIGGNRERIRDVADRIVDLEKVGTTPAGVNQFALRSLLPRWQDRAVELYINSLLSGPQTHATNILSNTLTALAQIPEHAVAAGVGAVRRTLPSQADTDAVLFSELGARALGLISGAKEGMRAAARAVLTDDAADAAKVEQTAAIPGLAGRVIRTPTRMLTAEDELFKGMARRMELHGLAVREARSEGLRGGAADERAADLVLNPTDEMLSKANDYARYVTFQQPLDSGSMGAGISRATQRTPLLKLIVPFVRTPMNLLKFAAERSPAALVMRSWHRDFNAGGARRDLAIARALVGTGIGAAMYEMAASGQITGGGPSDLRQRALMIANGWQPYSLKVGDRYYSYARLDPFSTTIGTAADLHEMSAEMDDDERAGSAMKLGAAIINNLSSKTWLSGLSSVLEAANDPGRYLDNFLARTAGSIAVPALVAQVASSTDPLLREARTPIDRIRSRVPGVSQDLLPRRDVFGRAMEKDGSLGPDLLSPLWTSRDRKDPVLTGLLADGLKVSKPSRKVAGQVLTDEQYDAIQVRTGEIALPALRGLLSDDGWKSMDHDAKQDAVSDVMREARSAAKASIGVLKGKGRPARGAVLTGAPTADDAFVNSLR